MLRLRRMQLRVRSLLRKSVEEKALEQELAFHLAELKAENMSRGMSEADADASAKRAFGSQAVIAEECREQRRTAWLEDIFRDLRFSLRYFFRNRTFSAVTTATLALCIGVHSAFLLTAYSIAFRPLPYANPERLVELRNVFGLGPVTAVRKLAKYTEYAGFSAGREATLQLSSQAVKLRSTNVTWNLLRVLGSVPKRGRWFSPDEENAGANRVLVLSERTWRNRFGGDENILGRAILVNDQEHRVIGIMPDRFAFPSPETEVWLPVTLDPRAIGEMWGGSNLIGIGRLRNEVHATSSQGELRPIVNQVRQMFPWRMPDGWGSEARLTPLGEALTQEVRPKVIALAVAAFLLLLIGCVNVMNLLLAQAIKRERELSMREALGARRGRLVRQLLTESFAPLLAGSLLGLIVGGTIVMCLPGLFPPGTPRLEEVAINRSLILAVAGTTALTAVLFLIFSLIQLRRRNFGSLVARAMTPSRRSSSLSIVLIGGELALGTALLIGAGLMGRTLFQLGRVNAGFDTSHVVSARVSFGKNVCDNFQRCWASLEKVAADMTEKPGVQAVSWANTTPLTKDTAAVAADIKDHPKPPGAAAYMLWKTAVTPSYFAQLGITLRKGRLFNDSDRMGTLPVILVSESTARRFWPKGDAIGQQIRPASESAWRTVVGVVNDVRSFSLTGFPEWVDGAEYEPLAQDFPRARTGVELSMFVKAHRLEDVLPAIETISSRFVNIAVSRVVSMDRARSDSIADQRSTAALLGLFAILGLLLGVIGVHGVVSHRVGQRTREIGIRLALGASAKAVVRMLLLETAAVAAVGLAVGVLGAATLTRFLQSLLFGVTSHDAITFVLSPTVLLISAVTAALVPALRVSRTDPARTLRQE